MKKESFDIIVIGGGPAGMMAAGRAGALGARVLLIEKNDRLGKKLSITGGRRCNITNAELDNHRFLDNFPESKQFLYSPLSQFNVQDTFTFFEDRGLPLVIEDRNRTFPKSQKAEDVCKTLEAYVQESGNVKVLLRTEFLSFTVTNKKLQGISTTNGFFSAPKIMLATGGLAAPETGSTGEALSMLASIGHSISDPDPNLAPLCTKTSWVHSLAGVSVDDMTLRFIQNNKVEYKKRGRLLFTHFGISGPLVINSSHTAKKLLKTGPITAAIDVFPNHDLGSLDTFFIQLFEKNKNKLLKTVMKEVLQKKLAETLLSLPELQLSEIPTHSVTKEQRKLLVKTLKNIQFPITSTMGFEWSIVADGGVIPEEIHFKKMTSKLFPNLYLIGDTININRPSGGFSLQLCWTTGWIAGSHAAQTT